MPLFLGIDVGTSAIKAALWDSESGVCVASSTSPVTGEMQISSPKVGWAEQNPESWWEHTVQAVHSLGSESLSKVEAIGISYQMHGLVLVDADFTPVRPSIIWCDSRASAHGEDALHALGEDYCYGHLLNSPGNFTASKMRWVLLNEPEVFRSARYAMLPGDYICLRMTGDPLTTRSGLSEMVLWDFEARKPAHSLLDYFEISASILPPLTTTFGPQGRVSPGAASMLGVAAGTPLCYRAGDQPNNAFSLGCLAPGDVAATGGTSGVVYGVSGTAMLDRTQRFNTFLHVNDSAQEPRYGMLLCVNGCGSLYSWLRNQLFGGRYSYSEMNLLAAGIMAGSEGLLLYPFGNGAERILCNAAPGASILNLDFQRHTAGHLCRAAQEGIAFSLLYGMEAGMEARSIRAGNANLFLSDVFCQTFSSLTGATLEIWDTDGATGAARGAAVGAGAFARLEDVFCQAKVVRRYQPMQEDTLRDAYARWRAGKNHSW